METFKIHKDGAALMRTDNRRQCKTKEAKIAMEGRECNWRWLET